MENQQQEDTIDKKDVLADKKKDDKLPEQANYVGLSNIGATCYMNSVLQMLFMTPEFRHNIYEWKFNAEDSSAEDCIPLQLQVLFAKMQLHSFPYVDTKDLAKSFGWDHQEGWEQHDTQEFVKILFDAIERSFIGSKNQNFINDIFEGTAINYVKCSECGYESITQENFLDLVITVKNHQDKIYNDSVEKGIQRYLKPEILEKDNQYSCTKCEKKVDAQRGARFCKLPKILSFVLNRFTFDFRSMKRIKLDDFVSFPFVLNMNEYINGYEGIKNKLNEDADPDCFLNDFIVKPPISTRPKLTSSIASKKNPSSALSTGTAAKKKVIPPKAASSQTRQFLQSMRQKKVPAEDNKLNPGIGEIQGSNFVKFDDKLDEESQQLQEAIKESLRVQEDSSKVNNTNNCVSQSDAAPTDQQKNIKGAGVMEVEVEEQKVEIKENSDILESKKDGNLDKTVVTENNEQSKIDQEVNISKDNFNSRHNRHFKENDISVKNSSKTGDRDCSTKRRELSQHRREQEEKQNNYKKILQEHLSKHSLACSQLTEKYLLEGPLVYELYAILIHSGGAYGGHYYAYIKDTEDSGKWHSFNDTAIMEIDVNEINDRVFGGNNTNAYLLFYRQWEPLGRRKPKVEVNVIPPEVMEIIEKQKKQWEEEQIWKLEQSKMMAVKVHYILNVIVLQVKSTDTLKKVLENALEELKIKEKKENVRLRRYKPMTDTKLDAFEEEEQNLSLQKLKINHFTSLCLEIKKDDETFESYDAGVFSLKVIPWKASILSLEQTDLNILKVSTRRGVTVYRLMEQIARAADISFEQVVIVRCLENIHGINTTELISVSTNYDTRIEELGISEGNTLYVEEKTTELKWAQVFENDSNKIIIKFNNPIQSQILTNIQITNAENTGQVSSSVSSNIPVSEYVHTVQIDGRESMENLKVKICEELKIEGKEMILRRGGRAGIELKDMSKTVRQMNLGNHSCVYLEFGKPAKEGEVRVSFYLATPNSELKNYDSTLYNFLEIGELPILATLKASEVRKIACEFLKTEKGIVLDSNLVRLREKFGESLTRLYREKTMREQQVIEKRMIAIEAISKPDDCGIKDYLISFRFWDQQTWTLSKNYEVFISKSDLGPDFAKKITEQSPNVIAPENMMAVKVNAIWNFSQSQLINSEWFKLMNSDVSMYQHPFHLMSDGTHFIIKDEQQIPRDLKDEEMKEMGIITVKQAFKKPGFKRNTATVSKEKVLSIKVKKKESQKEISQSSSAAGETSTEIACAAPAAPSENIPEIEQQIGYMQSQSEESSVKLAEDKQEEMKD